MQPTDDDYYSFCGHVRELCLAYMCSVTSWFRTARRNAQKGGVATSYHLCGLACDLVPDDENNSPAIAQRARQFGLDAIIENDHVHVELDVRKTRAAQGGNQ